VPHGGPKLLNKVGQLAHPRGAIVAPSLAGTPASRALRTTFDHDLRKTPQRCGGLSRAREIISNGENALHRCLLWHWLEVVLDAGSTVLHKTR
jgi:hypothetical protein